MDETKLQILQALQKDTPKNVPIQECKPPIPDTSVQTPGPVAIGFANPVIADDGIRITLPRKVQPQRPQKFQSDPYNVLQISRGAYAKAQLYAKLVSRIAGGGMECYGYLLAPKDSNEDVIRDVSFAPDQDALSAYVRVQAEGVHEAAQDALAKGFIPYGWWHSHGTMHTFHSGTDRANFETILHDIATITQWKTVNVPFVADGTDMIFDTYRLSGVISDPKETKITNRIARTPFAFSMVVNDHDERYVERATKVWCDDHFEVRPTTHPRVELMSVEKDVELDVPRMEWELEQKIRMPFTETTSEPVDQTQYTRIVESFQRAVTTYAGKHKRLIESMFTTEKSPYELLLATANAQANQALTEAEKNKTQKTIDVSDADDVAVRVIGALSLVDRLAKSDIERYKDPNTKFTRFELETQIVLQLMTEITGKSATVPTNGEARDEATNNAALDTVVERHAGYAATLKRCAKVAQDSTGTLCRYAMANLTDYDGKFKYKYTDLVQGFLQQMANGHNVPIVDAIRRAKARPESYDGKESLIMRTQRVAIFNQLLKDTYYMEIGKMNSEHNDAMRSFLAEFPPACEKHTGQEDSIIKKYIIPIEPAKLPAIVAKLMPAKTYQKRQSNQPPRINGGRNERENDEQNGRPPYATTAQTDRAYETTAKPHMLTPLLNAIARYTRPLLRWNEQPKQRGDARDGDIDTYG